MTNHDSNADPVSSSATDNANLAANANPGWERAAIEKLAYAAIDEQRARRRWGIFFKLTTLILVFLVLAVTFVINRADVDLSTRHTALIEIDGTIEAGGGSGAADTVLPALNKAFLDTSAVGIILRINSPGGSPVQAGIINDEITRLRKTYPKKQLVVVVDEMCASGGYYIAVAAEKIFVNKASIVGSIGVLMDGFGFSGLMEKVGVERRVQTAGTNKAFMDPFSPSNDQQKAYAQSMLDEIHQQFIDVVRKGRGKRLHETPDIFSGLFWTGSKAVEMGLADGFGTVDSVARDVFKAEDLVDYTQHEGLPERVLKKFGAAMGSAAAKAMLSNKPISLH
ncbi:MAG: S49 family peptidase [Pseudomonadota bacterium]|nr:S49 family peptidase [Pseudomonadota bacterium]